MHPLLSGAFLGPAQDLLTLYNDFAFKQQKIAGITAFTLPLNWAVLAITPAIWYLVWRIRCSVAFALLY